MIKCPNCPEGQLRVRAYNKYAHCALIVYVSCKKCGYKEALHEKTYRPHSGDEIFPSDQDRIEFYERSRRNKTPKKPYVRVVEVYNSMSPFQRKDIVPGARVVLAGKYIGIGQKDGSIAENIYENAN